jgi:AcrR family transcriptional regulator
MVRSAEETKRLSLDAATTEFAVHGLSGVRIDRIMELSGINEWMIYVYFESKENLFDCVLTE